MSVYTTVNSFEMAAFLRRYDVGSLLEYEGISEGIENTNYFVNTNTESCEAGATGSYVLTIFEWQPRIDIPYFLELMAYLSDAGLPCPHPIADRQGGYLQTLCGKSAALISRLAGCSVEGPGERHCEQVGTALATLHGLAAHFRKRKSNKRDWHWCAQCARKVLPLLDNNDGALLKEEIERHRYPPGYRLPQGIIHADLFRDNVLFDDGALSGMIDFYYACGDNLIYDLAITVNDWCSDATGALVESNYSALVSAYAARRAFFQIEEDAWQDALRRAALRFWLSRLHDIHFRKTGQITHVKNPDVYRNILLQRKRSVLPLC